MSDFARLKEIDQKLDTFDCNLCLRFFRACSQMRCANHSGHAKQRAVGARFLLEHIQCDAGDNASLETLNQSRFLVNASASTIDQPHTFFEDVELLHADQVLGLVCQWRMDGQVIDPG